MWRQTAGLKWAAAVLTAASSAFVLAQGPGDLVLTPTRVYLNEQSRSGSVTILNRGAETVRYRLTLVDMEMSPDGVLSRVPAGAAHSAINVLKVSPREIVLEPGASQRIKILVTFPAKMPDGELRSHLAFDPIALPERATQEGDENASELKLKFQIRSAVTIPVIVRHGRVAATATISEAKIVQEESAWTARFKLGRTGNRSMRGDVTVSFLPAAGGRRIIIGAMSGLPVYVPNTDRNVSVRLTHDVASLGRGQIEIRFAEMERGRGAAAAMAVVATPG